MSQNLRSKMPAKKTARTTTSNLRKKIEEVSQSSSSASIELARDAGPDVDDSSLIRIPEVVVFNSTPTGRYQKGIREWSLMPRLSSIEGEKKPINGSRGGSSAPAVIPVKSTSNSVSVSNHSGTTIVIKGAPRGTVHLTFSPETDSLDRSTSDGHQPSQVTSMAFARAASVSEPSCHDLLSPGRLPVSPPIENWRPQLEPKETGERLTKIAEITEVTSAASSKHTERGDASSRARDLRQFRGNYRTRNHKCHTLLESRSSHSSHKEASVARSSTVAGVAESSETHGKHLSENLSPAMHCPVITNVHSNDAGISEAQSFPRQTSTPLKSTGPALFPVNISAVCDPGDESMLYPHSSRDVCSREILGWNDATSTQAANTLPNASHAAPLLKVAEAGNRTTDCCCSCHTNGISDGSRPRGRHRPYHPNYLKKYGRYPMDTL